MVGYWHRSVMKWDFGLGLETDLRVTDWLREDGKEYFHSIHGIKAVSLPKRRHSDQRRALLEISILRVSIAPTDQREAIRKKIEETLRACSDEKKTRTLRGAKVTTEEFSHVFAAHLILEDGEDGFCDLMIELVRAIFKAFGVEDESDYRLADFTHEQKTLVWLDHGWITWERWLRIRHGLPLHCTADMIAAGRGGEEDLEYLPMQ